MQFITQPFGAVRLGDFLLARLADPQWTTFRAAIAFVKRSGTLFVRQPLQAFSTRAEVKISVGVDLNGTSREALTDLLGSTQLGQVFVYRNNGPSTFHPKVYVFKSAQRSDVLVGSGNLTRGGLYTNYEASLAVSLDLTKQEDAAFLQAIEVVLDTWSQPQQGHCYSLTPELIEQLVAQGLVRTEAELQAAQQAAAQQQPAPAQIPTTTATTQQTTQTAIAPLFVSIAVPQPPQVTPPQAEAVAENAAEAYEAGPVVVMPPPGILASQVAGPSCYVMTLQNTDVGVGQTTSGTSRRSPEVFIPLLALDQNPAFWTFPDSFVADTAWNAANPNVRRNGIGKLDRSGVPMRIGVVQYINMFFNPQKRDFRLRNEALRSAGNVGDILLIRRVDPSNGFEFDIQVAPQGSPLFEELVAPENPDKPHKNQ